MAPLFSAANTYGNAAFDDRRNVRFRPIADISSPMQNRTMKRRQRSIWATAGKVLIVTALLAPLAFCSALYLDGRQAENELPYKVKALEEACSRFPIVDAKGAGALRTLKRSISSGERTVQDVRLESGEYNQGVYEPFPGSEYDELQLMRIDVVVDGQRLTTARVPTLVLPTRGIGLNAPPERTRSCPNSGLLTFILQQADLAD